MNQDSWLDQNVFSDKSTGLISTGNNEASPLASRVVPPECQNLPAYKNWISERKVSPVKNQLNCASSYILAAVAALESASAIEFGKLQ